MDISKGQDFFHFVHIVCATYGYIVLLLYGGRIPLHYLSHGVWNRTLPPFGYKYYPLTATMF